LKVPDRAKPIAKPAAPTINDVISIPTIPITVIYYKIFNMMLVMLVKKGQEIDHFEFPNDF
jgi:hypothetical protein